MTGAMLPVYRAQLPRAEQLLPYLQQIDATRWYSNRGGLVSLLEARIGDLLGAGAAKVVTSSNGTAAIEGAIFATAGPARPERPLALMPAYTFVATASAAERCGYTPYLLDVDPESWMLAAGALLGHPALERAGVVIPVAPYGRAVAQAEWIAFQAQTTIPVVIDAAAAFEAIVADPDGCTGAIPVALSFQATKAFGTGEGGAVVWSDFAGLERVARASNFGMLYSRESTAPGMNGKMSEYHAAVGLAALDAWDDTCRANRAVCERYRSIARAHGLESRVFLAPDVASNYALIDAGSASIAADVGDALRAEKIEFRLWYGRGLHHEPYLGDAERDPLPATDRIAPAILGLPIAIDIAEADIARTMATAAHALALYR